MARLVSFLAVFLIPLTASFAAAAGSQSPALGGSGGDAFVTNCSDDEVLVGVRVRADAWLDSIAPRCVKVTDAGAWQGTVRTLGVAGGTGASRPPATVRATMRSVDFREGAVLSSIGFASNAAA
jgi:hypothetical protein